MIKKLIQDGTGVAVWNVPFTIIPLNGVDFGCNHTDTGAWAIDSLTFLSDSYSNP